MTYGDVTSSRTVRLVHENERIVCSVVFEAELKSDSMRSEHAFTLTTRSLVASRATVSELLEFPPLRPQRWAVRAQGERRDSVFHRSLVHHGPRTRRTTAGVTPGSLTSGSLVLLAGDRSYKPS